MDKFSKIRPYEEGEMKKAFEELLADRQFNAMMKGLVPWLPKFARNGLFRLAFVGVKTPLDFQKRFMKPVVNYIIRKYTAGCDFDDHNLKGDGENAAPSADHRSQRYTFISNHRDIVLDSAFLDVMLVEHGYPTTVEIGIGDNLLIYPWIKRLVRMNKAFTVHRGLSAHEMMKSSQLMSEYIHYAVNQKKENIWIAQREGRAKDSDDRTQESVLKMLAMGGTGDNYVDKLRDLNIVPLNISYEYDPCDYLKAKEFQLKRDNPNYKKSKQDDLENMKTGIFGYKGNVYYTCGTPVNNWIDELKDLPKNEFFKELAHRIDLEIHRGYELCANNILACSMLDGDSFVPPKEWEWLFEEEDSFDIEFLSKLRTDFEKYLSTQIAKIDIPNKDEAFLRERILTMYANPVRNQMKALGSVNDDSEKE